MNMTEEQRMKRRHIWIIKIEQNGQTYYFKGFSNYGRMLVTKDIEEALRESYRWHYNLTWRFNGSSIVVAE